VAVKTAVDADNVSTESHKPMTPQELRELLDKNKNGDPDDDCLMCGS
jgi:ribonucleoside-diphosphate reductase alpha chain